MGSGKEVVVNGFKQYPKENKVTIRTKTVELEIKVGHGRFPVTFIQELFLSAVHTGELFTIISRTNHYCFLSNINHLARKKILTKIKLKIKVK